MEYKVIDLFRALYNACDGNLEMPIEGICLSGGEAIRMGESIPTFVNGEFRPGSLFGFMDIQIKKTARRAFEGDGIIKSLALQRGGIGDVYMLPHKLNKTIEL